MQYTTILLAAGAALLAQAQSDGGLTTPGPSHHGEDQYLSEVCMPTNSSNYPDLNAPCNELFAVQAQCIYGPAAGLALFNSLWGPSSNSTSSRKRQLSGSGDDDDGPAEQSNSTQRICVCESQFFDLLNGCVACEKAHGATFDEAGLSKDFVASMSSTYCAASTTPTADLANFLNDYTNSKVGNSSSASHTSTGTFSDPIGNKTAVSLYYTQSVTGSAAWLIAQATGTTTGTATGSSGSQAASTGATSLNTVSGQIRPTATGASAASGSGASGTGTSSAGAMRTEAAAVAGVLGFAGLVALL